jgi:hypothetical protein
MLGLSEKEVIGKDDYKYNEEYHIAHCHTSFLCCHHLEFRESITEYGAGMAELIILYDINFLSQNGNTNAGTQIKK